MSSSGDEDDSRTNGLIDLDLAKSASAVSWVCDVDPTELGPDPLLDDVSPSLLNLVADRVSVRTAGTQVRVRVLVQPRTPPQTKVAPERIMTVSNPENSRAVHRVEIELLVRRER